MHYVYFSCILSSLSYMYRNDQVMCGNVKKSGRASLIFRCKSLHSFILRVLQYYNHRMNLGPTVFISEILLFLYLLSLISNRETNVQPYYLIVNFIFFFAHIYKYVYKFWKVEIVVFLFRPNNFI